MRCACPTLEAALPDCLAEMRAAMADRRYVLRWGLLPALGLGLAAVWVPAVPAALVLAAGSIGATAWAHGHMVAASRRFDAANARFDATYAALAACAVHGGAARIA